MMRRLPPPRHWPRLTGALFGLVALTLFTPTCAATAEPVPQPPAPLSRSELNPATETPGVSVVRSDALSPPSEGPCPIDVPGLTFQLKAVTFAGASTVRARDLTRAYARQLGAVITLKDVCRIRDNATRILFRMGVLARVDVPPQKIADGTLTLTITQAVITSVEVRGGPAPIVSRIKAMMSPYQGRLFDMRRFYRDLALANELPGVSVSPLLRVNPSAQGGMDLILTVRRRPVSALVFAQNSGSPATGRETVMTRIDLSSFTPWGEQNTLVVQDTPATHRQQVVQWVGEARPLPGGWVVRGSASVGRSRPGGAISPLSIVSDSFVASASVSYPIIRTRLRDVVLTTGMEWVDQHTNLFKTEVFSKDHLRIAFLGADLRQDWAATGLIPAGALNVNAQARQGLLGLGASSRTNPLTSRYRGASDGLDFRETARANLFWAPALSSQLPLTAQQSGDPLLSYESLSAGGASVGRGYDPSAISGDSGVMGAVETRFGPVRPGLPLNLSLPQTLSRPLAPLRAATRDWTLDGCVFFESARVERVAIGRAQASDASLKSVGAGIGVQLGPRLRADITYAKPLDSLSKTVAHPPPGRWLVRLIAIGF